MKIDWGLAGALAAGVVFGLLTVRKRHLWGGRGTRPTLWVFMCAFLWPVFCVAYVVEQIAQWRSGK